MNERERAKTERIYHGGEYVGYIKDRGYICSNERVAFCLPGGGVLFTRSSVEEVRRDLREYVIYGD